MDISTSLLKALDVLSLLAGRSEGMTFADLSQAMSQPRSNIVRIANTLTLYGLAVRRGRALTLTPAFYDWSRGRRHSALRAKYRPALEAIAAKTRELVLLGLPEGNGIIHIDYIEADHAVRVAPAPDTRHNLRVNALGKLALSRRPDLIARLRDRKLLAELADIRRDGVAWNREESVQGMIALAHPGVENIPTEPMIAVAWPAFRFSEAKGRAALAAIRAALRTVPIAK